MLTLTDAARRNLHLVCGRGMLGKPRGKLYEIANETNIAESELRLGGPPVDNVAIDEEGSITLVRLVSYSAALGISLSLLCFRSVTATIMIFFVGGISAIISVALVWWLRQLDRCDHDVDAVAGLCARPVGRGPHPELLSRRRRRAWPCAAHGAGHRSRLEARVFVRSDDRHRPGHAGHQRAGPDPQVRPLLGARRDGDVHRHAHLPARRAGNLAAKTAEKAGGRRRYARGSIASWPASGTSMGGWIVDHHGLVAIGCTLIIAVFGYGVIYMRTSVNLLKMFHSEAKIIKDYAWLEENLGQLVPMEVVVRVPKSEQRPSNAELGELQQELAACGPPPRARPKSRRIVRDSQFQLPFLERMELAARVQNV